VDKVPRSPLPMRTALKLIVRSQWTFRYGFSSPVLDQRPALASPADEPRFTGNTIADATLNATPCVDRMIATGNSR